MKRLLISLAACLCLTTAVSAYSCKNEELGFSLELPTLSEEVSVEETSTGLRFFHIPSKALYGGLIGSLEVVRPRSQYFAESYQNGAYELLAMGKDAVYLWKNPAGGVQSGGAALAGFRAASSALTVDQLQSALTPLRPDAQPIISTEHHRAYLYSVNGQIRPDAALTRGELAGMLYALLDADNKAIPTEAAFSDLTGQENTQAIQYLASYGIVSGYADGTFHPDAPISRAAFAVLLHRCQFTAPVGLYGDAEGFSDVPETYWAADAVNSAKVLGWMTGGADGQFHPNQTITRAQAVTTINRMLGRDESQRVSSLETSPFSDLSPTHWAYQNILEAAGEIQEETSQPLDTGVIFFSPQTGVSLRQTEDNPCVLQWTADGGSTWNDLLQTPAAWELCFPMEQFPTQEAMQDAVVSAELRPMGDGVAALTVWYHPYDSIYPQRFQAVKQTVLTETIVKNILSDSKFKT